ncbi:MAG: tyrosine-type recombinase/integrase [Parahaliea sp.]
MTQIPEMCLFDANGARLYLDARERVDFLRAAEAEEPPERLFCQVLHMTGCRPSEALELVAQRVLIDESTLVFRSLKKRKRDQQGRQKADQYRSVPVPRRLVESLDLVFNLRALQKRPQQRDTRLWPMSRPTAYRLVKRVMQRAGIEGKQATAKGLRHGFGVAMVTAEKPLPVHILARLMGHSDPKTTEIYLQVVGQEYRDLVLAAWKE